MIDCKNFPGLADASGEEDLGNIDILRMNGDAVAAEGDWGAVKSMEHNRVSN
jgi:hypothetical protein